MNFVCPHCGVAQAVTERAFSDIQGAAYVGHFHEMEKADNASCLYLNGRAIRCANDVCERISVDVRLGLGRTHTHGTNYIEDSDFLALQLYPGSTGKPFPEGVPDAMLEDYNEAWSVIELSPKSAATLARRCLQAMIRDFCGIRERTLYQEIQKLEDRLKSDELPKGVEPETVAAMKVVKDKGNIGAHMTEIDGAIVNVDPGEAEQMLGLIEMLFTDWYVARHKRLERLAAIEAMATR